MKKRILCFSMSVLMLTLFSCNTRDGKEDSAKVAEEQNEETFETNRAEEDSEFAVEAADGSLLEVELGNMALQKATSPEVKKFAQMMVQEHSKANEELKSLAQKKNITLPTELGNKHKEKVEDLSEKSGEEFDKEYMDLMVKDHKEDVKEFEEQAQDGTDAEIKEWASSKLGSLRQHLQEAERVQEVVDDKERG